MMTLVFIKVAKLILANTFIAVNQMVNVGFPCPSTFPIAVLATSALRYLGGQQHLLSISLATLLLNYRKVDSKRFSR